MVTERIRIDDYVEIVNPRSKLGGFRRKAKEKQITYRYNDLAM